MYSLSIPLLVRRSVEQEQTKCTLIQIPLVAIGTLEQDLESNIAEDFEWS